MAEPTAALDAPTAGLDAPTAALDAPAATLAASAAAHATQRYAVAARELLRSTLLDAAVEQLQARRWSEITMAHIAHAAGVSRQTLYNEFGSREQFAQVLVMREASRLLDAVEQAVMDNLHDPAAALAAAFDVFLAAAAHNPLVRTIVTGEGNEGLIALFTTQGGPLVQGAAERLTSVLLRGWPTVARQDAELLSDCLVRLAISYAALPASPASTTAASISTLLAPYVERVLADSGC
jgi:AcrR family transcriptional regulator